jgi:hypothetical protein
MMKVIGLGRTTSALLAGVLLSGCCIGRLQLTVTAAPHSNGDRPVYVLVAEVDAKTYEQESYDAVVAKVAQSDDSVRWVQQLAPGEQRRACILKGKKGLGVYVLYAQPTGTQWRVRLEKPPGQYELLVK